MEIVIGIAALILFLLPSLIAAERGRLVIPVIIINVLLGWTFIGWVVALAMACSPHPQGYVRPRAERGGEDNNEPEPGRTYGRVPPGFTYGSHR